MTSLRQTKPLKEMAEAARKFGHGEFETRVEVGNRQDEVGELAEAFNAMADSLAKSEAKRSEFVANISHELKTPMTTIAGLCRRHSGRYPPPGKGAGILTGYLFRDPPPVPAGPPGCWSSPGSSPPNGWPPRSSLTWRRSFSGCW